MKPTSPVLARYVIGRRALLVVAVLAVATALASCGLSRPSPVKRMFLLEPSAPAVAATTKPLALRIGVVNVAAPFRGRSFVYRDSELKYEADYYDEFFVAPTALSDATAKALTAARVFRRVVPYGGLADDGDYTLDGFASELYADIRDPAAPAAVLAITFYLSPAGVLGSSVLWSREYRQRASATGTGPDALAAGLNTAWSAMLADLSRQLAAVKLAP
jgi:hypothetical protein